MLDKCMIKTYLNPLNIFTFAIGLALLLYGAAAYSLPDWDVPVSILMAALTYLTAAFVIHILRTKYPTLRRRIVFYAIAFFLVWVSVDGSYWAYWSLVNPDSLMLRNAQYQTSLCLYFLCGLLWYYTPLLISNDNRVRG
jgi:hypothetical protein